MILIYRNRREEVGSINNRYRDSVEIDIPYYFDSIARTYQLYDIETLPLSAMVDRFVYKPSGCVDFEVMLEINSSLRRYVHMTCKYIEVDAIYDIEYMATYRIMREV